MKRVYRAHGKAKLIITADDFGRDPACNRAIAQSLCTGVVTAASLMANGYHFEEACALIRSEGLASRIGVHLTLDEGPPLSREMFPYADPSGELCVSRTLRPLGSQLSQAIEAELSAQIERVMAAGLRPTHLDSHRHIHTVFPIGRIVIDLAQRYGISYVRPARNVASRTSILAGAYKRIFNSYLSSRVRTADHFGDIVDFYHHASELGSDGLIECMVHLDDSPQGLECRRLMKEDGFLRVLNNFHLIGHADTNN